MLQFIQDHSAAFSAFGIALLDFLWKINPKLKGSGFFHAIYLMLGGKDS